MPYSTAFACVLDPSEVAVNRTQLPINSGAIRIDQAGLDWGDASIQAFMADLAVGSVPVDYRIPNRMIHIPLALGVDESGTFDTVRKQLRQKVALIQREGGWFKRQSGLYADVVNATLNLPDHLGETGGLEIGAVLTLECIPDFYGDEISLDSFTQDASCTPTVLKAAGSNAVILGDHPGRCRIIVSSFLTGDNYQVIWGFRCRHYNVNAPLLIEADLMAPQDAAATHANAQAPNGFTMRHNTLPVGVWCPVVALQKGTGAASGLHEGAYRVWARCSSATATPQVRLVWGVGDFSHSIYNDPVRLNAPAVGYGGTYGFYLLDLGEVHLTSPPAGMTGGIYNWHAVIQAKADVQNDPIEIDVLFLQPLDESAGSSQSISTPSPQGINDTNLPTVTNPTLGGAGGTIAWTNPNSAIVEDGAGASATSGSTWRSYYLGLTGFGFAIPTGSTIHGIRASIKRNALGGIVKDYIVALLKAGTPTGNNLSSAGPWTASPTWFDYGNEDYLWGLTWTAADINNANFGVGVACSGAANARAFIDAVTITIFYSTGGVGYIQQNLNLFRHTGKHAEIRTDGVFHEDLDGYTWVPGAGLQGDYPRIPPSGMEARPVELMLRLAMNRGVGNDGYPDALYDDYGSQQSIQVKYRPSYLQRS